jgi:hypothetical protein
MKNIMIATIVLFFLCISAAVAQPGPPSKEKHFIHLKRMLQLDASQSEKVKSIIEASFNKMKEMRAKIEAAHEKEMEEMDKLMAEQDEQISKVLNETQKKKFEEFNDEREMQGPGNGPGPQMMREKGDMHKPGGCPMGPEGHHGMPGEGSEDPGME